MRKRKIVDASKLIGPINVDYDEQLIAHEMRMETDPMYRLQVLYPCRQRLSISEIEAEADRQFERGLSEITGKYRK
jgi:hypothetical protein